MSSKRSGHTVQVASHIAGIPSRLSNSRLALAVTDARPHLELGREPRDRGSDRGPSVRRERGRRQQQQVLSSAERPRVALASQTWAPRRRPRPTPPPPHQSAPCTLGRGRRSSWPPRCARAAAAIRHLPRAPICRRWRGCRRGTRGSTRCEHWESSVTVRKAALC